jgi:replicative DNA helicase
VPSQAADVVLLIHRKAYYEERKPSHLRDVSKMLDRRATLVVDKTRDGQRAQVPILMDVPTAAVWEDAA